MSDELTRIFQRDRENQAAREDIRAQESRTEEKARSQVAHVLETEVRPVLEEVAKKIFEEGYEAQVSGVPNSKGSNPYVELTFNYQREGGPIMTSGSSLKFLMAGTGSVAVKTKIWSPRPADDNYHLPTAERSPTTLQAVNAEWTKKEALGFVRQVIDAWDKD